VGITPGKFTSPILQVIDYRSQEFGTGGYLQLPPGTGAYQFFAGIGSNTFNLDYGFVVFTPDPNLDGGYQVQTF
jgi:hypothetical protein